MIRNEESIEFLQMSRELFDITTFHDLPQLEGKVPVAGRLSFAEVIGYHREFRVTLPAPRYVFHHAFCCSTLLVRSLGPPGVVFAYREPASLTELALIDLGDRNFVRSEPGIQLLAAIGDLHCRVDPALNELPLTKACDCVNGIIEPLLEVCPDARAVLLYSDLEPFVMGCLASEDRRTWTKGRLPAFRCWKVPGFTRDAPTRVLSDGETAACLWALHMELFADLARRLPERVLSLDCEELLVNPADTANRVARFLGLENGHTREHAQATARMHAKTAIPYSAEKRRADFEAMRPRLRSDLHQARLWCETVGLPPLGRVFLSRPPASPWGVVR